MVQQYNDNVVLLRSRSPLAFVLASARKASRGIWILRPIDQTSAQRRTQRHADTPLISTPHVRRRVAPTPFDWADLIDNFDRPTLITDPTSKYAVNAVAAMNRAIDDEIIAAALAVAYGGRDGTTTYAFPTSTHQIVHGSASLTIAKLLSAKEILDSYENDPDEPRFLALNAKQVTALLNTTEIKSADYNTVKALAAGQIDSFLGFKFIRTERLLKVSTTRSCLAWSQSSILLGSGRNHHPRLRASRQELRDPGYVGISSARPGWTRRASSRSRRRKPNQPTRGSFGIPSQ
jgi:hypothetical protein